MSQFPHQPGNDPTQVVAGRKTPVTHGQKFVENLVLFGFGKAETRNQPYLPGPGLPYVFQAEYGEVEKMARLKIHTASMFFPRKREKDRVRWNQKRTSFNFPMEMTFGDVVKFKPAVLMLGQPCDAAVAKFFKKIEELAGLARKLPDHAYNLTG